MPVPIKVAVVSVVHTVLSYLNIMIIDVCLHFLHCIALSVVEDLGWASPLYRESYQMFKRFTASEVALNQNGPQGLIHNI